jgi:hypothetical protein
MSQSKETVPLRRPRARRWRLRAGVLACVAAVLLTAGTFAFHTGNPACDRALAEALKHGHLSVICPASDNRLASNNRP